MLLLPALGFALLALQWALFEERDARHAKSSAREQQRDDTLARLVEERFAPEHLQVESMADGAFRATARLTGVRRGRYRLNWGVRDGRRNEVLISDSEVLTLDAPRAFEVTFSQDDLARAYRDKLLGGHGGTASVEENFIFELSLLAVLSDAQMEQLPRYYIATSSEEKLAATAKTEVPVSFHVPE